MDDNTVIISIAGENESTEHLFEESDRVLNVDFDDIDHPQSRTNNDIAIEIDL